jgi:integrin-linked kinase-associated serine/threonine phosphatase 2C
MAHQKREASSTDEDWASKRPKGAAASTEKDYNVDAAASQETNGEKGDTSQKDNKAPMDPCISDEKSTAISKAPSQEEMILTSIEAAAAEDKGCRHAMEDAWVLLPDASMESPGNLRLPSFYSY